MDTATLAMDTAVHPPGADLAAALLAVKCRAAEPVVAAEEGGDVEGRTKLPGLPAASVYAKVSTRALYLTFIF